MYRCKYFVIEELVPEELYNQIKSLPLHDSVTDRMLWGMFPEEMLKSIDWVKEEYSLDHPVTINNWKWGGIRNWSGIRTVGSPDYSKGSEHSEGNAFDMVFKNITAKEIREDLITRRDVPFSRVEGGVGWLHIDNRPTDLPKGLVYCFNP